MGHEPYWSSCASIDVRISINGRMHRVYIIVRKFWPVLEGVIACIGIKRDQYSGNVMDKNMIGVANFEKRSD